MPRPQNGYRIGDDRVPGVTTILGRFKDSGGLLFWAFEQGKAAQRGEIARLYDKRDEAAEAGTLAHAMVEAHHTWGPAPDLAKYPEEVVRQAKQGFENYLEWQSNNKIAIVYHELELVSYTHRFGGCPDAIGRDAKGRLCLLDWKTSDSVYPDMLCQLAAYNLLWKEDGPEPVQLLGGYHLCRFSKKYGDFAHHYYSELNDAERQFLLFREAYDIDKKLKKRA